MPFVKKIEVEHGTIGIWELSETSDFLINNFNFLENEAEEYVRFTGEKRKTEYLATRLLLNNILGEKVFILYDTSGRPRLKNSDFHISISHSADFVVVFISKVLCGIDVENADRNIDRVTKRFLHPKELEWIENSGNRQFLKTLFWCAKEAIFKCSEQSGIRFDSQIFIDPFKFDQTDIFTGKLTYQSIQENYNLRYFYIQNNIMVYCVEMKKIIS